MSSTDDTKSSDEVCASCGIAAIDDVKLRDCDAGCDLVKYCSDGCQELHRVQHEEECKRRVDELNDKELFEQPDSSHLGECPICCLPLSIYPSKSMLMGCCCKVICNGCNYANKKRESDQGLEHRCPYCREPTPNSEEESVKQIMERVKKNDPVAICQMGKKHKDKDDYGKAFKYFTKAAELGDMEARACLANLYDDGQGVEKDTKKAVYHFEQAAIGGHPQARGYLGAHEMDNYRFERAVKHFMIAANLGCDISLKTIKGLYSLGLASKDDYAAALGGYQAAMDATKSAERKKAEEAERNG